MIKVDIIMIILLIILMTATISDLISFKIPNWLNYSALAFGISYFSITKGYEGFSFSLTGALTGFALLFIPYVLGGTGAGDVKLIGAVGSFLGAHGIFLVFILSCTLGGIHALFLLTSKGSLFSTFKRYGRILWCFIVTHKFTYIPPTVKEKPLKIRFGLAIALGTGSYLVLGL
jgi:prepilin peptidase CpaA